MVRRWDGRGRDLLRRLDAGSRRARAGAHLGRRGRGPRRCWRPVLRGGEGQPAVARGLPVGRAERGGDVSRIDLRRGALHVGCWLDVAPTLEAGCAALAIVDGPYNMRKAEWDCFASWDAFRDWYEPQVVALGRVLAASATVYLWGSDESAGELRPLMRRLGWEYLGRVTWDKVSPPVLKSAPEDLRRWPDVTEVADVWGREAWTGPSSAGAAIGYAAGADERNWIRTWLCEGGVSGGLRPCPTGEGPGPRGG